MDTIRTVIFSVLILLGHRRKLLFAVSMNAIAHLYISTLVILPIDRDCAIQMPH